MRWLLRATLGVALLSCWGATAAQGGAAAPAPRKLDPDVAACVRPATMARREIEACLDGLVAAAAKQLSATYAAALDGLEPEARAALKRSQEAFYAYAKLEAEAGRHVWANDAPGIVQIDAMINGVTRARQRTDELRLYLVHPSPSVRPSRK